MTPEDIEIVAAVVKPRSGLVLTRDRGYLVESRLGPVARREKYGSVAELVAALTTRRDERLCWAVTEALANTETFFFRDRAPWESFRHEVLPSLAASRGGAPIRVWSAGCSTGQEPYSLALLAEEAREELPELQLNIVATDASTRCLEVAQAGIYTQFEVQRGLPIRALLKYFGKQEDNWRLAARVRRAVEFKTANLIEETSALGRFDVILCRNVLSGFDRATQGAVLERLSRQLASDGVLLLGARESAAGLTDALEPVEDRPGYYLKTAPRRAAAA